MRLTFLPLPPGRRAYPTFLICTLALTCFMSVCPALAETPTPEPPAELTAGVAAAPNRDPASQTVLAAALAKLPHAGLAGLPAAAVAASRATVNATRAEQARLAATQQAAGSLNLFLALFPELKNMPAPTWLQEGQRVTYLVATADVGAARDEVTAGSGQGYVQYDVVAMDRTNVVASLKMYLSPGSGSLVPTTASASVAIPGTGAFWVAPAVLRNAERVISDEIAVVRSRQKYGNRTYQAVRFRFLRSAEDYAFDQETGLLVFWSRAPGDALDRRQLAQMTLVGRRQVDLPWEGETAPRWLARGVTLSYSGTYATTIAGVGGPPIGLPYITTIQTVGNHGRWTQHRMSSTLNGQPATGQTDCVTGVRQPFDLFWLPPEAFAAVKRSRTLDEDPVTGARLTATVGRNGTLTLTEAGPGYAQALTFSAADGALVALKAQQDMGNALIEVSQQRVQ